MKLDSTFPSIWLAKMELGSTFPMELCSTWLKWNWAPLFPAKMELGSTFPMQAKMELGSTFPSILLAKMELGSTLHFSQHFAG